MVAFVLLGALVPSFASGAASACSAWIGQPSTRLSATASTFEISRDGQVRQLSVAPSVYPAAPMPFGGSRVIQAPRGVWTATLRGQRTTTLSVERPGKHVVVDHAVQMGSIAWSPDGRTLAFAVRGARGRLASRRSGFHVVAIPATICSPYAWSRDSLRVAFVASTTGDCTPAPSTLDVADPATGAIISSAPLTAGAWSGPPIWSADGAFVAHDHLLTPGIAIAPRSATGHASSADGCSSGRWSPTGHRLATACAGVLTVIDAGTGDETSLTTPVPRPIDAPFWSPDGTTLASMSDTSFTVTPISGKTLDVPFGGCISARVLGFDRSTGEAVLTASLAPPAD